MQTTSLNLMFSHDYAVEEMLELSGQPLSESHFYFPSTSEKGGHDGLLIKVTPSYGTSWIGTFADGDDFPGAVNAIYSCPDAESICVIARGQGYVVNTKNPTRWQQIEIYPILDARPLISKQLLIFANFTRISAYGKQGHLWTTPDLSWDGIEITNVTSEKVSGLAWDAPLQQKVEFRVDLDTGMSVGGSSSKRVMRDSNDDEM